MGAVIGIDLGTTNTVVAAVRDGRAVAIPDESGSTLIPSIVSFLPSGAVLVGSAARERRSEDVRNTIYSVKRLIGRTWDSPEVSQAKSRFAFELREGPGRATFVIARGETYTLPEISAFVLRKAKSIAELELGETVDRAVITVPANFNDLQRAATKVAGRVAGLEVIRIINEPTAAALAFGHTPGKTKHLAVYDFGGGTFDFTLLRITAEVFEVLSTAGNTFLGGDDIDAEIVERMADRFIAEEKAEPRETPEGIERLRFAAEQLKIILSLEPDASVRLDELGVANGPGVEFLLTRRDLDSMTRPIIEKTFAVCRDALAAAGLSTKDIDDVLLVGGSTKDPYVRKRVGEFFGKPARHDVDPHEVVALGAAQQAAMLTRVRTTSTSVAVPPPPVASPATIESQEGDFRQKTQPFGRVALPTETPAPAKVSIVPPEGPLSRPIPSTMDLARRDRRTTGLGLGPTNAPGHDVLPLVGQGVPKEHADPGLPAAKPATPRELTRSPVMRVPAGTATNKKNEVDLTQTLTSALVRPDLPSVTNFSADLPASLPLVIPTTAERPAPLTESGDEEPTVIRRSNPELGFTAPEREQLELPELKLSPSPAQPVTHAGRPASLNEEEIRARYGNLPLIVGGKRVGAAAPSARGEPQPLALTPSGGNLAPPSVPSDTKGPSLPAPVLGVMTRPLTQVIPPEVKAPSAKPISLEPEALQPELEPLALEPEEFEPRSSRPAQGRFLSSRPAGRQDSTLEAELPVPNLPLNSNRTPVDTAPAPHAPTQPTIARPSALPLNLPPPRNLAVPNLGRTMPLEIPVLPAMPIPARATDSSALAQPRPQPTPSRYPAGPALLIDVTPLSLCVETAGGYSDVLVGRNTPVPCERTRDFVTIQDNQETVIVRVAQGESPQFQENVLLGEVRLSKLAAAPRGQARISVTFGLDSDGMLHVRALDVTTGQSAIAELQLVAAPSSPEVRQMIARQKTKGTPVGPA